MTESKRDRFIRIAEARTNKIISQMKLLGNCSNRNNYDYTEKDVKKIIETLENELTLLKDRYKQETKKKERFTLK